MSKRNYGEEHVVVQVGRMPCGVSAESKGYVQGIFRRVITEKYCVSDLSLERRKVIKIKVQNCI